MMQIIGFGANFSVGGLPLHVAKGVVQADEKIEKNFKEKRNVSFLKIDNTDYIFRVGNYMCMKPTTSPSFSTTKSTQEWIEKQYKQIPCE